MNIKKLCTNCNCHITANNYNKHINKCNGNPSWFIRKHNSMPINSPGIKISERNWSEIQRFYDTGKTFKDVMDQYNLSSSSVTRAVNQGLFKTRPIRETKLLKGTLYGNKHSTETKNKISNSMRKAVLEGRQKTPKPYGTYGCTVHHTSWLGNEEILHGGWEKKVAEYLDSKQINWLKSKTSFTYTWNNSLHEYFPDFYLIDYNVYIEVKGQKTEKDEAKWSQFPETLYIIDRSTINKLDTFFNACIL